MTEDEAKKDIKFRGGTLVVSLREGFKHRCRVHTETETKDRRTKTITVQTNLVASGRNWLEAHENYMRWLHLNNGLNSSRSADNG